MNRYGVTAFFGILMVPMALLADEKERNQPAKLPPREFVYWKPECNVKDPILKELDRFGKDMKAKLGETLLGHKPFIAIDNSPEAVALAETTVEQIVDRMLATLKTCADHDNEDFLPKFVACRRSPIASGSDLVTEPIGGLASVGQYSGNITFKLEWEKVDGHFTNQWDENDVDETYELELTATLTLGIAITLENDRKLTVIHHSVAKPLITGWRTTLVASEGIVQKAITAKSPREKEGHSFQDTAGQRGSQTLPSQ